MTIEPIPTTRAVIDPLRLCNIRCRFCYYKHGDMKTVRPFDSVRRDLERAIIRGCTYFDITGGEPTIYKSIENLVEYGRLRNMGACIITNAICGTKKLDSLVQAGLDGLLVSVHGIEKTHDWLVEREGALRRQMVFLYHLKDRHPHIHLRFNSVITRYSQKELVDIAKYMAAFEPAIVNFINFNPHHEWKKHQDSGNFVANLVKVEKGLVRAIHYLEELGVGVNVRYYPMCRLPEEYRRCVCNDLHVAWDPYEWFYDDIKSRKYEDVYAWSRWLSGRTELHAGPCRECDLEWVCGGINKYYYEATGGKYLEPVKDTGIKNKNDFYHYRKHNVMTLRSRNDEM